MGPKPAVERYGSGGLIRFAQKPQRMKTGVFCPEAKSNSKTTLCARGVKRSACTAQR